MPTPLRLLSLEDNESDLQLILLELQEAGFEPQWERVETEQAFLARLDPNLDIILADYSLPQFNAMKALRLRNERGVDVPFIIVSGSIGEDTAVVAMQEGAADYVLKDRLGRLGQAVGRALEQKRLVDANRRAEQALRHSEARYRTLFEYAPDGIVIAGPQSYFLDANASMCRMLGYRRDELIGKHAADIVVPTEVPHIGAALSAIKGKSDYQREWRFRRKDGSIVAAEVIATMMPDGNLLGMVRDITERKRTERRMAAQHAITEILAASPSLADASEQILRSLCQSLEWKRGELWLVDGSAQVLRCSTTWQQSLSRVPELEAISKATTFSLGVGLPGRVWASHQVVWIADASCDANFVRTASAVQAGFCGAVGFPLMLGQDVLGVMSFFNGDVAQPDDSLIMMMKAVGSQIGQFIERKRAEAELEESDERFRQIAENIRDVFWLTDPGNKQVLYVSPAYKAVWGRECDALYNTADDWLDAIHEEDRERVRQAFIAVTATGIYDATYRIVRPDGSIRWIHDRGFPVRNAAGTLYRVAGVAEDITEARRDAETKQQLEAQLVQSQKMEAFGQLAGGIAHDFNNLLCIISGYSELLLTMLPADDPKRDSVKAINEAGSRAASLTRQLLAFSRKTILEPKVLDLNEVVHETDKMLRRLLGEDMLLKTLPTGSLRQVKVDPGLMGQVLMNLAVNARDAMPQGGELTIATSNVELHSPLPSTIGEFKPGWYVLLAVADTGCGMTSEIKARIFEPFFTTKGVGKGTGLGLAVVQGIVSQSSGQIEVESEPGRGTTFKIYLPAVEVQVSTQKAVEPAKDLHGNETILLVEDEENVRALASLVLRSYGYQVLVAEDGRDALRVVGNRQSGIDLLLTDVVMPHVSGRELADILKPRFPRMKVLYMTGYTDDAVVRHGLVQGQMPLLQKPATPIQLVTKVRSVLDSPS